MRGLTDAVHTVLGRRLREESPAPLAIGLSGGGDSVALTLMAADWAKARGRRLIVLSVDHGLRPESRAWTQACADLAARLALEFHALRWEGDKPASGLPAAARAARHRLLANACREAGARVLLLGHTASDLREATVMRAGGSTTPSPREWSPSPAWPEGRGLFVLRPMLGLGRAELRAWLAGRSETWIEDPANDDLRFARARARRSGDGGSAEPPSIPPALADLARSVEMDRAGALSIPRALLAGDEARPLIASACLCAAGTATPPRGDRLERLAELLKGQAPTVATLAGARIEADPHTVRFMREPGEIARHGLALLRLEAGGTGVWDGRYEIACNRGLVVQALAGYAARLPVAQREALKPIPAHARGGLPVVLEEGLATCPLLGPMDGVSIRPLAQERLLAACGTVGREP